MHHETHESNEHLAETGEKLMKVFASLKAEKAELNGKNLTVSTKKISDGWAYGDNKFHGPEYSKELQLTSDNPEDHLQVYFEPTTFAKDLVGDKRKRYDGMFHVNLGAQVLVMGRDKVQKGWEWQALKDLPNDALERVLTFLEQQKQRQDDVEKKQAEDARAFGQATGKKVHDVLSDL